MEPNAEYYTTSEAAHLLRVSRTTLWRWIGEGRLAAYRVGGRTLRIRREDVTRALRPVANDPKYQTENPWFDQNPAAANDALRQAAGIVAGVDTTTLKKGIRESRAQGKKARPTSIVERTAGVFNRGGPPLAAEELRSAAELAFAERDIEPRGP
jgi:excisionase family DNA binding protein